MRSKSDKPTKLALRLAKRIKKELDIDVEPYIYRNYPGYNDRTCGVWSWKMSIVSGGHVGSCEKAIEIARAEKISFLKDGGWNDFELFAERVKPKEEKT